MRLAGDWLTDMRKGFDRLAALAQDHLRRDPFCGPGVCVSGRQGRLIKVLWWDGQGLCLFAKRLEKGRFIWPATSAGRPRRSRRPSLQCCSKVSIGVRRSVLIGRRLPDERDMMTQVSRYRSEALGA